MASLTEEQIKKVTEFGEKLGFSPRSWIFPRFFLELCTFHTEYPEHLKQRVVSFESLETGEIRLFSAHKIGIEPDTDLDKKFKKDLTPEQ